MGVDERTDRELPALLTEAEAYGLYGHVLQCHELRHARQRRSIGELAAFVGERLKASYVAAEEMKAITSITAT